MKKVQSVICLGELAKICFILFLHLGTSQAEDPENRITPQIQIYIVAGTLGGVVFILIILILALALSVSKIKDQLSSSNTRYTPVTNNPQAKGGEIFAYDNGAYNGSRDAQDRRPVDGDMQERIAEGNDDLEKMGYSVYNGRQDNPPNRYSNASQPGYESRAPARHIDGVVPLHDGRPRHQEKRRF